MIEPGEVSAVLAGTGLAGLPIAHGPRGTLVVSDIDPGHVLEAWRVAYALVPVTGRWPVAVTTEFSQEQLTRPTRDPAAPTETELSEFDAAARARNPWQHFRHWLDDEVTADTLEDYAYATSGVQLPAAILEQAPLPATEQVLYRWVYDQLLAEPDLAARIREKVSPVVGTGYWYTPGNAALALLPTDKSWLAAHWVSFYGALGREVELAAVLHEWDQKWGARLVACWDTMLQFIVERPPAPGEEAFALAGQIKAVAANLHLRWWELATALPTGTAWFIHNRP